MSMRGDIISAEYKKMIWVKDEEGKEFACYSTDVKNPDHLSENEKEHCLDSSLVLGDSW